MTQQTLPITPLGNLVFIQPEQNESIKLAIIDERKSWRGRVIAVGPGKPLSDGSVIPMPVEIDNIVYLHPSRAIESVCNQARIWITDADNILAVEEAA